MCIHVWLFSYTIRGKMFRYSKNRLIEAILLSIKKECLIWETWKKNNLSMHNYFEVKHYAY